MAAIDPAGGRTSKGEVIGWYRAVSCQASALSVRVSIHAPIHNDDRRVYHRRSTKALEPIETPELSYLPPMKIGSGVCS